MTILPALRRARSGALLALLLPAAALAAPPAEPLTLYADATVIDGTGAAPRPHQDLLVKGERIVAVGPHGSLKGGAGAKRVDLAGRFVIPGLIDSHVHLATPPNRVKAEAVLRRNLYGGVTAVRDMADDLRAVGELARASRVGEIAAPDIYYAALMAGPPFFEDPRVKAVSEGVKLGTAPWMQSIDDTTDLSTAITLAKGTSATAIKIYADLPGHLVQAITAEAHRQKMMVWAHSSVFPARPSDGIAAAPDSVSHVCYLAYELQPVNLPAYEDRTPIREELLSATGDDPVMAKLFAGMKAKGIILDATGSLFVSYDEKRKTNPSLRRLRCTGPAAIRLTRQAWKAGVAISTGTDTDHGPEDAWPAVHDELRFLAKQVGMPPIEVIHAATLVGAQAAGQAADMGSIEPGKLANFVVLANNPAADIAAIGTIESVVKRGRAYPRADYKPVTKEELGDDD
jgi:imidazolonepropionase-like amidohydrolase